MADKKKLPAPSIKKVWVSKYGLSKGVYELEVEPAHSNGYVIQGFFSTEGWGATSTKREKKLKSGFG